MRKIFLEFQGMAVLLFHSNLPSKTRFCYRFQIKESTKLTEAVLLDEKNIFNMYFDSNSHLSFPSTSPPQMADEHSLLFYKP